MRLGQEFSGYARQVELALDLLAALDVGLGELPLGGTAIGTGINTHPEFAARTIAALAAETGLPLREAANHFEAQAARDACVQASGTLRTIAISLTKIANDIRWLGSGPRCGLGELRLPATQPGSSIMPGKVNPVMSEMLLQVAARVQGNDTTIAVAAAQGGTFELHVMMPVMADALLESIRLLARGAELFARRCVAGLEADEERCASMIERSLALGTALVPAIGYDHAAAIAKEAHATGRTIREVAAGKSALDPATLARLLDPATQAGPPLTNSTERNS
jgi:fumarate hydratase class II